MNSNGGGAARLLVTWKSFGPYHYARLEGLSREFEVLGVEWYARERARGWGRVSAPRGVRVVTLHDGLEDSAPWWRTFAALRPVLREFDPDLLLLPGYAEIPYLLAALEARRRARTLLMFESTALDRPRRRWKEAAKAFLVRRLFDGAVTGGVRSREYILQLGMPPGRVAGYCDVVDNVRFRRPADSSASARREGYFLYVGRLSWEKNLERLIEAYARYRSAGGTRALVLAGGGPLEAALRAQAGSGVEFVGAVGLEQLVPLYHAAAALVLPSVSEPWGLVVNEAMAAGLPVLVSERCGCVDDLVRESWNGWTFDPLQVEALTRALQAADAAGAAALAEMGRRGEQIVAEFTPARMAAEVQRLSEELRR